MAGEFNFKIYIISKGRSKTCLTAKYFKKHGISFFIVVEPQEFDDYRKEHGDCVISLPFSNLGLGSYPARNFCWEHSIKNGDHYHWIFDDNIRGFAKWVNGKKTQWEDYESAIKYVERYAIKNNVDVCGFEYRYFVAQPPKKPFKNNCHVYSALFIKNSIPYRWRLKYNEDVDLCLQVLHNGGKTASCVYYMTNKTSTAAKMKGGNQDELYKNNDPLKKLLKAKMLEAQWPQYVKTVIRFNRYHHFIDWKIFNK